MKKIICFVFIFTMMIMSGNVFAKEQGYIVKIKDSSPMLFSDDADVLSKDLNLFSVENKETAQKYMDMGIAEYIQPDNMVYLFDYESYNDNIYKHGLCSYIDNIQATDAFNKNARGQGVKIGIIDSGITYEHEDFDYTFIDEGFSVCDDETMTDTKGHGTFVTGIIGATSNNSIGIPGIADKAYIIPIKAFNSNMVNESYIIKAIDKASSYNLDILNMSFGMDTDSKAMFDALKKLSDEGVILVAAVGNNSNVSADDVILGNEYQDDNLYYPAAYDFVIGVGAVDGDNNITDFSVKNKSVFLVAPGKDIYSTRYNSTDGYSYGSGTSFSCPIVSSAIAVLKSIDPALTCDDIKELIKTYSKDLGKQGYDTAYGWGLIQIDEMIKSVLNKNDNIYQAPFVYENNKLKSYIYAKPGTKANNIFVKYNKENDFSVDITDLSDGIDKTTFIEKPFYMVKSLNWDMQTLSPLCESKIFTD